MASYTNPVVRGNAPDPSAIRVGDDYYLATSTFGLLPGIVIRHSTDLVNWRIIGHAVTRPAQYRRDGQPGPIVLFAPTLRHHDGRFYLATTNVADRQGNFYVTTEDPAGEWSDAIWIDEADFGFDPSLFRDDDGVWYYTRRTLEFREDGNLGAIVQTTIDIDTGVIGEFQPITADHRGFVTNDIEGPHLYKIDGRYYLSAAEGSSWKGHMQTIGRSDSPWGPFEPAPHNPILSHRDRVAHPIQSLGHAELVDTADGDWWALSLGTRHAGIALHHNLGRETFLTPVRWVDGWPVVGTADGTTGGSELEFDGLTLPAGQGSVDRGSVDQASVGQIADTLWTRGWSTLGVPAAGLDEHAGDARIELPAGARLEGADAGPIGALLLPQTEDRQRFSATVAADSTAVAGVAAFATRGHLYSAVVEQGESGRRIVFSRAVDDLRTETVTPIAPDGDVVLRIDAGESTYSFSAEVDGVTSELGAGSARLLSAETASWFVGVHFALVAIADAAAGAGTGHTDAAAVFLDVIVSDTPGEAPSLHMEF
ncbi:glycoside hydrolase family 43 protein [Microterricola viridarii]|uniref:Alpha-N-arabinofuranosidase n=1 Tax=Microterricola viridarii TaxID=412690 RepID=A0A1H1PJV8_9MICO|nr:glycoside hydrolase family 43 protein [Microterricola viridarii]SDS10999.1 alpha-N-arabinofuranosidase [Microterricola viridarii]